MFKEKKNIVRLILFLMAAGLAVFAFTYGIHEVSGGKAEIKLKNLILNPGSISVIIGIPLFLLQLKVPEFITNL